jgi:WD40 repeat protein
VLAISPDGRQLAAGTSQRVIYVCSSVDLLDCRTIEADGSVNDLRFSDSGDLFIADKNIRLATLSSGAPTLVRGDGANYGIVRLDAGRRKILTIDGKGAVMTVDMETGNASPAFCCSSIWGGVEFIRKGQRAIWAGHWPGIWDFQGRKLVGRFTAQREFMAFGPVAIDPAAEVVFMGSQDGHVYVWNLESRELLSKSPPLSGYVMTISVLGKSGWIAYASQPGVVHLWSPNTGARRVVQAAFASSNIVFDQQRQLAAFGTTSGTIEFWDLLNERRVDAKVLPNPR